MRETTKLLRVGEAADLLNLSHKTVWAMIYRRDLDVVKIGRSVRIPQSALEELIERGTVPAKKQ